MSKRKLRLPGLTRLSAFGCYVVTKYKTDVRMLLQYEPLEAAEADNRQGKNETVCCMANRSVRVTVTGQTLRYNIAEERCNGKPLRVTRPLRAEPQGPFR